MEMEYRIKRIAKGNWQVYRVAGFLDVKHVCWRQSEMECKHAIREHAEKNGWKAIVIKD